MAIYENVAFIYKMLDCKAYLDKPNLIAPFADLDLTTICIGLKIISSVIKIGGDGSIYQFIQFTISFEGSIP